VQVEILEETLQKERDTSRHTIEQHVRALKTKEQESESLREQISKLPLLVDYRALQRQLKIMQVLVCVGVSVYAGLLLLLRCCCTDDRHLISVCFRVAALVLLPHRNRL